MLEQYVEATTYARDWLIIIASFVKNLNNPEWRYLPKLVQIGQISSHQARFQGNLGNRRSCLIVAASGKFHISLPYAILWF